MHWLGNICKRVSVPIGVGVLDVDCYKAVADDVIGVLLALRAVQTHRPTRGLHSSVGPDHVARAGSGFAQHLYPLKL